MTSPNDLDLKSLDVQKELNPKMWDYDGHRLNSVVRKRLLKIALHFYKELKVDWVTLKDIRFTGSLANYNWSKYSDIDLHLILDFKEAGERNSLIESYFKAKKSLWNNLHDIKIHGYEVEVYIEDDSEAHYASGLYSVLRDEWLIRPEPKDPSIDRESVKKKTKDLMKMIDELENMSDSHDDKIYVLKLIDKVQDKIKNMRKCGLEKYGEFSTENLAFKLLRRNSYLQKLYDMETKTFDSIMSIK